MFKFKQNIGLRLKIGFGVVLISFCLLSVFAVYKMNELADISHQIYNHPLTVSNAVRDIRAEILSMHRSMKDVVLAKDQQQLNQAINAVANSEDEVYKSFDTIFERYLGDSRNVQDAYNAFKEWTNIKQEVIELVKQGSSDQAAEITTSKVPSM